MSDYGAEVKWTEAERRGQELAIERDKWVVSPYRLDCKWWMNHLSYCASLPAFTTGAWLDVVEAWAESVDYREAVHEINRMRRQLV